MNISHISPLTAFLLGLAISVTAGYLYTTYNAETTHPVGYADSPEEVHVHSDFIVFIDGATYDFTEDKYQTTSAQQKHAHVHLHDNVGHIIHRHDHGVTLGDFFSSLDFTLTDECITTDTGETFCTDDANELVLYVDGIPTTTIASHVNRERERLLLYYGDPNPDVFNELLEQVTDEACIYSGTCPERGIAPPESCGLTCGI